MAKNKASILVVDDEPNIREVLEIMLKREKMNVQCASNGKEALELYRAQSFDLVISDIKMPKMDGMELLRELKNYDPHSLVLMITAHGSTESAVEAMKLGAFDFLTKPFKFDDVKVRIQKALENRVLVSDNLRMRKELGEKYSFSNIIGNSPAMHKVFDLIKRAAPSGSNVLVTGDSGTGKELIAKAIHFNSKVSNEAFLSVNCGAIPENLMESEFFGHVKGAFTGAIADKKGYFEAANGGTLFLDEVGELPMALQAALLRVIAEGTITPVGSTKTIETKVQLVAATNRNLENDVADGKFREDLFFRLNVIKIEAPALLERKEDIPMLVNHFVETFSERFGRKMQSVSSETMDLLKVYRWPGNVRELENVVERMMALDSGPALLPDSLPEHIREPLKPRLEHLGAEMVWNAAGVKIDDIIAKVEREFLLKALEQGNGTKKDAARLLNISLRSMRYRLEKYGLDGKD